MEEKKIKIRVSTIILLILLIISIISILLLGFFNIIANKEKSELVEKNENLENKVLNIENENNNFKSEVDNKNKKIEEMNKSQNQIQEQLQASQGINANEKVFDPGPDGSNCHHDLCTGRTRERGKETVW